jgi:hypothetical protein
MWHWLAVSAMVVAIVAWPSPAMAADAMPAPFASWSPTGSVPGQWSPYKTGTDALLGGRCSGGLHSWQRPDHVVFGLLAYTCSGADLATYIGATPARRAQNPAEWFAVPSALPANADDVGPAGSTSHYREWVEGDYPVIILVNCPTGSVSRDACLDLSAAGARSVSAAVPGDPRPGVATAAPPSKCCVAARTPAAATAEQVLANWRPDTATGQDWADTNPQFWWNDKFTSIECNTNEHAWRDQDAVVFVQWWTCDLSDQPAAFARRAAVRSGGARWTNVAPALGPHADTLADLGSSTVVGHARTWAQGDVAVMVGAQCGHLTDAACAALTATLVRDIHHRLPGEVASTDLTRIFLWDGLGLGLLLVGGWNLGRRTIGKIEYLHPYNGTSDSDRWRDVTVLAGRARRTSRSRYIAQAMAWLGAASAIIGALGVAGAIGLPPVAHIGAITSVAALVLGLLISRRGLLRARSLTVPVQDAAWLRRYRLPRVGLTPRRIAAIVVLAIGTLIALAACTVWLVNAWIHAGGDLGSPRFASITKGLLAMGVPVPVTAGIEFLITFLASTPAQTKATVLLGGITAAVFLTRLGLRLGARSMEEMSDFDHRRPVLLLRNFKDDRIRIRRSRLTQLGFLRATFVALSYLKWQRFQEFLQRQLSELGPVIAIAPRHTVVPQLGAAQAAFSDDMWEAAVREKMSKCRAVVFLAAPERVTPGLRTELELMANKFKDRCVILIIPPRVPAKPVWQRARTGFQDMQTRQPLLNGWATFRAASQDLERFAPISEDWVRDGVHVMVHVPDQGWWAWGAGRRSDWTYAVAIHEATAFIESVQPGPVTVGSDVQNADAAR